MLHATVAHSIRRLRGGDRTVTQHLWDCYYAPLTRVASVQLKGAPRGAADEEDVALSALDDFFRLAESQQCGEVDDHDKLWRLLVVIATRKVKNLLRDQGRLKRGGRQLVPESRLGATDHPADASPLDEFPSKEQPPDRAVLWAEEIRHLLHVLEDERLRAVAELRFAGYTNDEIAVELSCTRRSVQRWLRIIRVTWRRTGIAAPGS